MKKINSFKELKRQKVYKIRSAESVLYIARLLSKSKGKLSFKILYSEVYSNHIYKEGYIENNEESSLNKTLAR